MDQACLDIIKLLTDHRDTDLWDWENTWKLCKCTVAHLLVPAVSTNGSRPIEAKDFSVYVRTAEKCMKHFIQLSETVTQKLGDSRDKITVDPELAGLLLLLYAEHSSAQHWTSEATIRLTDAALQTWTTGLGERSVAGLLSHVDGYKHAMKHLLPLLDRPDWKCNPAAVAAFRYVVRGAELLKFREGEQRVVMAVSLRLVDDFELANVQTGVECLHHIVSNVVSEHSTSFI